MQRIVINSDHGGFGLSPEAMRWIAERRGLPYTEERAGTSMVFPKVGGQYDMNLFPADKRNDLDLIGCVEALGMKADGDYSSLRIVEIPDGVEWQIEEYDGREWVAEKHRTWS